MKELKIFIFVITTFLFLEAKCQFNFVTNPSFEATLSCPSTAGCWNSCSNWNNVNMQTGMGLWGTPDFFHSCGTGNTSPPSTFAGTCAPHTGNGMMAIIVYNVPYQNYREYISNQLACPLLAGNTYLFSFWITNGTGVISPWTIKNIGANFSSTPLTQNGWSPINAIPQCEVTSNIASNNWVQYSFTVTPTANWSYLTIGAFRNDISNNPVQTFPNPGGNPSVYANYYIDDILVAPLNTMNLTGKNLIPCSYLSTNLKEEKLEDIEIFPNPISNLIKVQNISSDYQNLNIYIYDLLGNEVLKIADMEVKETIEINSERLTKGIYLLKINNDDKTIYQSKIIKL